jgi:hypothetical protein
MSNEKVVLNRDRHLPIAGIYNQKVFPDSQKV